MAEVINNQRTWTVSELWKECSPTGLLVSAFDGHDAYFGILPLTEREHYSLGPQSDNSDFDKVIKKLKYISPQNIYPTFLPSFTRFERIEEEVRTEIKYYFKAPNISSHCDDDDFVAKTFLEEVKINEKLMKHPHPYLAAYFGCVVHDGRITRLVFRKYFQTLYDRTINAKVPADFTAQERTVCMNNIEAAATHLHQHGLAHNDITPTNIMFDGSGFILIDFDCCAPLGSELIKGGSVAGWRGPHFDNGKLFKTASIECDQLAIDYLRDWLMDELKAIEGNVRT